MPRPILPFSSSLTALIPRRIWPWRRQWNSKTSNAQVVPDKVDAALWLNCRRRHVFIWSQLTHLWRRYMDVKVYVARGIKGATMTAIVMVDYDSSFLWWTKGLFLWGASPLVKKWRTVQDNFAGVLLNLSTTWYVIFLRSHWILDRLVCKHWVARQFRTIFICDSFIVTIIPKGDNSSDIYSFCDSWS